MIKFRGKRLDDPQQWEYGYYQQDETDAWMHTLDGRVLRIIPDTLGQFTGLQDSNGNDIYEGDILKDKDWEIFEDKKSFVVSFDDISPRFLLGRTDGRSSIFQLDATFANRSVIIANIHDNPELLKGGEKWL